MPSVPGHTRSAWVSDSDFRAIRQRRCQPSGPHQSSSTFASMLLTAFLSAFFLQATPLPLDSLPVSSRRRSGGALLGASIAVVDHSDVRLSRGPVAGFYYSEPLGNRWAFQIEFHWKQTNGYNLSAVFADTASNPTGIGTSIAAFNVRTLVYWEIPIMLCWRPQPDARHAFAAGVRPSRNVLTGGQRYAQWSRNASDGAVADLEQLNVRQGLRRSDLGILVGWNYALTDRLSLDARYTQGLYDLTADNFFKSKSNTLNSDLQVTLRARF